MRLISIILVICVLQSCSRKDDFDFLIQHLNNSQDNTSYKVDSIDNAILRYDDKDIVIDKHWFNENNRISLYTIYNRFFETSKAGFIARFKDGVVTNVEGYPLYLSSDFIDKNTLVLDTLKAYLYIANSPFFDSNLKILKTNISKDEVYLTEMQNPNFFIYYEDYPDSLNQKMDYGFYTTIRTSNFEFIDSLNFNITLHKKTAN
jgi:hypothetical protein